MIKRICVFCGSNSGARPEYLRAAEEVGGLLADRRIGIVFGGGKVGIMGRLADAALARGGEVVGVIPKLLTIKEVAHTSLSELRVVNSMHERKALMAELADAFIALPGGFGTFEEFFEVLTWAQLGIHEKPCGLLNVCGYFDHLTALANHAMEQGFVKAEHRHIILSDSAPSVLLEKLESYQAPKVRKWIGLEEA